MRYLVELTERAMNDLAVLYQEKTATESMAAVRWFNGLEQAIADLETHPRRCPAALEAQKGG